MAFLRIQGEELNYEAYNMQIEIDGLKISCDINFVTFKNVGSALRLSIVYDNRDVDFQPLKRGRMSDLPSRDESL